jgi:hypothetical protein
MLTVAEILIASIVPPAFSTMKNTKINPLPVGGNLGKMRPFGDGVALGMQLSICQRLGLPAR